MKLLLKVRSTIYTPRELLESFYWYNTRFLYSHTYFFFSTTSLPPLLLLLHPKLLISKPSSISSSSIELNLRWGVLNRNSNFDKSKEPLILRRECSSQAFHLDSTLHSLFSSSSSTLFPNQTNSDPHYDHHRNHSDSKQTQFQISHLTTRTCDRCTSSSSGDGGERGGGNRFEGIDPPRSCSSRATGGSTDTPH